MPDTNSAIRVEPGQLWIDNDPRNSCTRYVRIHEVDEEYAHGMSWRDEVGATSRPTRIKLARFRPTATGYRLAPNQEAS